LFKAAAGTIVSAVFLFYWQYQVNQKLTNIFEDFFAGFIP